MLRNSTIESTPRLSSSALPDASQEGVLKKPVAVYPVLFGWLFLLVTYREIMPFGKPLELLAWVAIFSFAILALQFLVSRLVRWPAKAGILTAIGVVAFCFFGDLRMQLERWLEGTQYIDYTRLRYLLVAVGAVSILLGLLTLLTSKKLLILNRYLNLTSALMVAATAVQIVCGPSVIQTADQFRSPDAPSARKDTAGYLLHPYRRVHEHGKPQ